LYFNFIFNIHYSLFSIFFLPLNLPAVPPSYIPLNSYETQKIHCMKIDRLFKAAALGTVFTVTLLFSQQANAQSATVTPKEKRDKVEDRIDRKENHRDRKENRRDRREDRKDKREDVRDKREDVRDAKHDGGAPDKAEDRRDKREDVRDKREDVRDKREDVKDRKENRRDRKS
jgi:hypothetical protein